MSLNLPLEKGMWVKSIYGDILQIVDVCDCSKCIERGFLELKLSDGNYITNYEFKTGFKSWRKNSLNREDLLIDEEFKFCQRCHSQLSKEYWIRDFCPLCGKQFLI